MNSKDILIAEKVMGWRLYNYETDEVATTEVDYERAMHSDGWAWDGKNSFNVEAWEWMPTSNLEQAFQVVNRIPLRFCVIKESNNSNERKYKCWFTREDGESGYPVSYSDSLPEAICKAVLKTIDKLEK